jgi:beta-1,4-mannosyl-glycoprotein beta-1,4-N-acetylglucosaminyltransferase
MMIYDVTIGFNELDLFLIRYNELKDIVDRFVIVEATHTHSGKPKPLEFTEWRALSIGNANIDFEVDWGVIDIIVWNNGDEFAPLSNQYAWQREDAQREVAGEWIKANCESTDICLFSDMDEIPSAQSLGLFIQNADFYFDVPGHVWVFAQNLHYLYFNTFSAIWRGTKIFQAGHLQEVVHPMKNAIRYLPEHLIAGTIKDGGWHFSSCGGVEKVRTKFDSYAHTELQSKTNTDIAHSLKNKVDPFNGTPLALVSLRTLPKYVQDNVDYFTEKGYLYGNSNG